MSIRGFGLSALALSVACGGSLFACTGDDVTEGPSDAGDDASPFDGSLPDSATSDGSIVNDGGGDAGPVRPPWALFSFNYSDQSDMVALSIDAGAVDGVLNYPAKYGVTSVAADGPWLLEQNTDLLQKLDPSAPWKGGATWNVAGTDGIDGGAPYADPYQVVAGPAGKDYVIRFNRNRIAVIDSTKTGAAIAPEKFIDLSSYLAASDEDGAVDMVSGVYVASQHRLYVLLGNIDLYLVDPKGYFTLCGPTHSEIVAIDTDTDTLVSAVDGGSTTAPFVLGGYNAIALFNDVARGRLLALTGGCSDPGAPDSGVAGPTHMREIDAYDLASGVSSVALDLNASGFPSAVAATDSTHYAIGFDFGFGGNIWDVTTSTLGADIVNVPDTFTYDRQGHLVGSHTDYLADGGTAVSLVSVRLDDGGVNNLGAAPFRKHPAFVSTVDFWTP